MAYKFAKLPLDFEPLLADLVFILRYCMIGLSEKTLSEAFQRCDSNFDETFAGFGVAPKFPRSHTLSMILRVWSRSRDPRALEIVERTLGAMARGGLYDQLGGGFHRYSTDGQWRVPHF